MYDFPELQATHDTFWAGLRGHLQAAGLAQPPALLTRGMHHARIWSHPSLLLAQACEYPLAKSQAVPVRLVATPHYRATGCSGSAYRSAILVRKTDPTETLQDLQGRRCVINEATSNSGMNLFRAVVAPIAHGNAYFGSVLSSGSHRRSLKMVASEAADVSAIDCVTWALLQRIEPLAAAEVRVLGWSPATPSLPYITAATTDDEALNALRVALVAAVHDSRLAQVCQALLLEDFDIKPSGKFSEVLQLEREASALGYPELA